MNKPAIKTFAVWARKELIASVSQKAYEYGVEKESVQSAEINANIVGGRLLTKDEVKQRGELISQIKAKGFEQVMEEVAYTWFNRFIALRFMEVNGYLPTRVRVFTDSSGNFKPEILADALHIDLEGLDKQKLIELVEANNAENLYKFLLITQCNALNSGLPDMFEKISNYTELLFPNNLLKADSVPAHMVADIPEEDWREAVEIIGWMYQFYNTEPKDETFALLKKNVKITKERIPSATQLFTPDWIVRYMVENSLGRLALESGVIPESEVLSVESGDSTKSGIRAKWKYYLDEAEQTEEVKKQLNSQRSTLQTNFNIVNIKVIDPCMGSGHILVYAFDVLMDIYKACGYAESDAAKLIVEKNLFGLDIDDRATQLAYFAVMMKGRQYDRRFLTSGIKPNLCAIQESNSLNSFEQGAGQLKLVDMHKQTANYLIDLFGNAKEFGSILNVEQKDYDGLLAYIQKLQSEGAEDLFVTSWLNNISEVLPALIKQAKMLAQKYEVVVTNPPYMGSGGMSAKLSEYVQRYYPDSKSDLFAVFIEKCGAMAKKNGYQAMITQPSLLFLSSFEKLRNKVVLNKTISSLLHMGRGIFGIDFGSTAFVYKNCHIECYIGCYFRLHERTFQYIDPFDIAKLYVLSKGNTEYKFNFSTYVTKDENLGEDKATEISNKELQLYYEAKQESFTKIPGSPIAFWLSEKFIQAFVSFKSVGDSARIAKGLVTANNDQFVRIWSEVDFRKVGFGYANRQLAKDSGKVWYPYAKGGLFRRWYGNFDSLVNWENDGYLIQNTLTDDRSRIRATNFNLDRIFKKGISWTVITSGSQSFRLCPDGYLFDAAAGICQPHKNFLTLLGFLNSIVAAILLKTVNPTLNLHPGYIECLPFDSKMTSEEIEQLVSDCIEISRADWDAFEVSWDFQKHPLI